MGKRCRTFTRVERYYRIGENCEPGGGVRPAWTVGSVRKLHSSITATLSSTIVLYSFTTMSRLRYSNNRAFRGNSCVRLRTYADIARTIHRAAFTLKSALPSACCWRDIGFKIMYGLSGFDGEIYFTLLGQVISTTCTSLKSFKLCFDYWKPFKSLKLCF